MSQKGNDSRPFKLGAEKRLAEYLRLNDQRLAAQLDLESDEYITNVDEEKYGQYLTSQYELDMPHLDFDGIAFSTGKKLVPAERFPPSQFNVRAGRSYEKGTVIFHIPYTGDVTLLQYYSDSFIPDNGPEVYIQDKSLCFEIIDFHEDLERIKRYSKATVENIRVLSDKVLQEIDAYNYGLASKIRNTIRSRKNKANHIVQTLGVPIKKTESLPAGYEVPTVQSRSAVSMKPEVAEIGHKTEYSLDQEIYVDILQVIYDYGRVFEQYPSTYTDKREEALRDHFLLNLQPRFKGGATGETFNKIGKTDILIRYEGATVFIAECKFWAGARKYLDTISQLLSYLTWRNSKAAAVIFVRNKDFSSVLKEVRQTTPTHPNFKRVAKHQDETWLNFILHLNDDREREIQVAVLLFHIPSVGQDLTEVST